MGSLIGGRGGFLTKRLFFENNVPLFSLLSPGNRNFFEGGGGG